jgi:hypothetical protein
VNALSVASRGFEAFTALSVASRGYVSDTPIRRRSGSMSATHAAGRTSSSKAHPGSLTSTHNRGRCE